MKTPEYFTTENKIFSFVGDNFKSWFYDMDLEGKGEILVSKKLTRTMNNSEILSELKPEEVTLGDIKNIISHLDKNDWSIFYVKDKDGVLCAVLLRWDGNGWRVGANSVANTIIWRAGSQVFSRSFLETLDSILNPSLPDTLVINGITYKQV